ncbi:TniQ family protein [Palleronia caenipelagi]|nr:TniQ family protein [Palleronia caenipelagi]
MFKCPNLAQPLRHEETATSYVSRLTRYVGVGTPFDLCRDLGLEWQAIVRGEASQLRALAALGGADESDLNRWSVRALGGLQFQIGQDVVPNKTLLRSRPRLCPRCILEDLASGQMPYRRVHWNLLALRTCAHHQIPLIQLPHLEHTFGNYDFVTRVAACDDLIRKADRTAPPQAFSDFEAYLLDRLRKGRGQSPFLDDLSLTVIARMAETLGLALAGDRTPLGEVSDADLHAACTRSFRYLLGGEDGLLACFRRLQRDPLQSNASHKLDFGAVWIWLSYAHPTPEIERIRALVHTFVFSSYPVQRGTIVLGQRCPKTQVYSVNSAKREHGISRQRLVRCLVEAGAGRAIPGKRDSLILTRQIRAKDIDRILSHRDGLLPRWDAVALLGQSDKAFRLLRLNGAIRQHKDAIDQRPMYDPAEIETFLAPIFEATLTASTCPAGHVLLREACQRLGTDLIGATDLIRKGQVRSARLLPDGQGLDRIRVDPEDLREALKREMIPAMSKLAAAAYLRTSLRTVAHLIDEGLLELVKRGPSLKGFDFPAIPETSLEAFLKDHTTLGRIAAGMGTNFMFVMHGLEKCGVEAVTVPKGIGRYYQRSHLKDRAPYITFKTAKTVDWDKV